MQSFPKNILLEIKKALVDEDKRIASQIQELWAQDPFSDTERIIDNAASDAEANEESSHDRFSALVDELKRKRVDVQKALERIEKESYGFCGECGQMIDTDRLGILLTAILCLACEQKRKH
jgi:RNA polymerase-binding transcription factor DksA